MKIKNGENFVSYANEIYKENLSEEDKKKYDKIIEIKKLGDLRRKSSAIFAIMIGAVFLFPLTGIGWFFANVFYRHACDKFYDFLFDLNLSLDSNEKTVEY